jgi:uncharacterized protein (TIGR03435 family)
MYKNVIPSYLFCVCCTVCAVAIAPMGTGFRASAQTPSTDLSFEVATVKPIDLSRFSPSHFWAHVNPAGASYWSMTPFNLIEYAYDVEPFQVTGPEWANHDLFDIEARFPEGADKKDDRRMLQALLKDRFKLAFHIEKRELEVHVLVVGKHGEKLTPSLPDPVSPQPDASLKPGDQSAGEGTAKPKITKNPDGSSTRDMGTRGTQTLKFNQEIWAMHYERSKISMEELAQRLSNCLGSGMHKVVDETGIKETYQLAWDCPQPGPRPPTRGDAAGMLPSDPEGGSALTQSLDALGLKLEKRKMLQDVYVIDHVERPSEN